jgi:hypothetical protein
VRGNRRISRANKLLERQQPNLTLHTTPALTPDWPARPFALASVVAIDLADDVDPCSAIVAGAAPPLRPA